MGMLLCACKRRKINTKQEIVQEVCPTNDLNPSFGKSFLISPTVVAISNPDRDLLESDAPKTSLDDHFATQRPCLSEKQQEIVLESWEIVQHDLKTTGIIAFHSLFEAHPEMIHMFAKFHGVPVGSIRNAAVFVEHVMFVMSQIEKVIARLKEHGTLETMLHDIGDTHRKAGVGRQSLTMIIPFFIDAIKPAFDVWTEELEQSWVMFMQLMCHVICEKMDP